MHKLKLAHFPQNKNNTHTNYPGKRPQTVWGWQKDTRLLGGEDDEDEDEDEDEDDDDDDDDDDTNEST